MKSIVFRNKGVIDPRSITTFGVSSKENAKAIGFFGTGLKYAISILLRNDCKIVVYSDKQVYTFDTVREKIRNDEFDFIRMNGVSLGFTTELGKTWKMWQAFRELWCNCADEHGESYVVEDALMVDPVEGETLIVVTGEPFFDVWADRSSVVLTSEPVFKSESVNIHRGASKYLFYRGIRVFELPNPSRFTYDIQAKQELTEDRTLASTWYADRAIARGLVQMDDPHMIKMATCAPKETYEGNSIDFNGHAPSEKWMETTTRLATNFEPGFNSTALAAVRTWAGMSRLSAIGPTATLSATNQQRLNKAISFCKRIGYPVDEYPIITSDFLGEGVLGRAEDGTIYLSTLVFNQGTKMVAGTLAEEYLHLKYKVADESRNFQNFLIDALMSLGEQLTGEVL